MLDLNQPSLFFYLRKNNNLIPINCHYSSKNYYQNTIAKLVLL